MLQDPSPPQEASAFLTQKPPKTLPAAFPALAETPLTLPGDSRTKKNEEKTEKNKEKQKKT